MYHIRQPLGNTHILKQEIIEDYVILHFPFKDGIKQVFIDLEDLDKVLSHVYRWSIHQQSKGLKFYDRFYVKTCLGIQSTDNRSGYSLHQFLKNFPEEIIDHRDRNGLNNRKKNLFPTTQSINMLNAGPRSTNTSGTPGVRWNKEKRKWEGRIYINYKARHLGYFDDKEVCIKVVNEYRQGILNGQA